MAGPLPRTKPVIGPTLGAGGGANYNLRVEDEEWAYGLVQQRWQDLHGEAEPPNLDINTIAQQLLEAYPDDSELAQATKMVQTGMGIGGPQDLADDLRFIPEVEIERWNYPLHQGQRNQLENPDIPRLTEPRERRAYLGTDAPVRLAQAPAPAPALPGSRGGRSRGGDSPSVAANRAYIQQQIDNRRAPIRYRYSGGGQPGAQGTATPLRFHGDGNTLLTIDHATRTPRSLRLDRLETLSDDEPRPEPMRTGDPAEQARGEEFRARRKSNLAEGVDDQLGLNLGTIRFQPDRDY